MYSILWQALGGLPLGNGLGADRKCSGKLCLGQALGFPQLPDVVSCCGITLPALDIAEAEDADEHHQLTVERVEDELFVTLHHPMEKNHYISFLAYLTGDKLQLVKLYPASKSAYLSRAEVPSIRELMARNSSR